MMTATTTNALYKADVERALLGCVLLTADCWPDVAHVQPSDFFIKRHQWLWRIFGEFARRGEPIDYLTVRTALEQAKQLDEFGGDLYLAQLLSDTPTALHAPAYAATVRQLAARRELMSVASNIAKLAHDETRTIDDVLTESRSALAGVSTDLHDSLRHASHYTNDVWEMFSNPAALTANIIPTGFAALDTLLGGGLERQTATALVGMGGMGKSAWLAQVADAAVEHGRSVAVFTLEMSGRQIIRRIICQRLGINWQSHKDRPDFDKLPGVLREIDRLQASQLHLDELTPNNTNRVRVALERMADRTGGVDVVLADHLRLFKDRGENEVSRLGLIMERFKDTAKALRCACIVACQLNRNVEQRDDKRPTLADIRASGEIAENSDYVIGLYRDDYYRRDDATPKTNTAEMWVLKQRDGESNTCAELGFNDAVMQYHPLRTVRLNADYQRETNF